MSKHFQGFTEAVLGFYEHQFLPGLGNQIAQLYASLGVSSCSGDWRSRMPYDCEALVTWTAITGLFVIVSVLLVIVFRIDAKTLITEN